MLERLSKNSVERRQLPNNPNGQIHHESVPAWLSDRAKDIWKKRKYGLSVNYLLTNNYIKSEYNLLTEIEQALFKVYFCNELVIADHQFFDSRWPRGEETNPIREAYGEISHFCNNNIKKHEKLLRDDILRSKSESVYEGIQRELKIAAYDMGLNFFRTLTPETGINERDNLIRSSLALHFKKLTNLRLANNSTSLPS